MNLRVLLALTAAGTAGIIAAMPLTLSLYGGQLQQETLPVPLAVLLLLQIAQSVVLLTGIAALGLWLGGKVGLGEMLLTRRAPQVPAARRPPTLAVSAALGGAVALLVLAAEETAFVGVLEDATTSAATFDPPFWQRLLAVPYGGITEEVLARLGLFSVLAWLVAAATGRLNRWPGEARLWAVNAVVGLLFGALHLPATALVAELTGPVVGRALALNLPPSLLFGWLYWRHGLLAAIVAHLSADVVLQVGATLVSG